MLLPELIREVMGTSLLYRIADDNAEATILLEPLDSGGCIMTVNINESELWGWRLGVPGRSELGITTRLGSETSSRCEKFCDDFIEYLEEAGYFDLPFSKGGRPPNVHNEWARRQIEDGKDIDEVRKEYITRRSESGDKLVDIQDSFQKAIRGLPKN